MLFSVPDFIGFACREVGKINKVIVHTVSSLEPDPSGGGGEEGSGAMIEQYLFCNELESL